MALKSPSRTAEHFLPSTFEDRGVAVPFTTPLLAYSRARKGSRGGIELCVARFADSAGFYVIPWRDVREVASLTVHDVALHEEVIIARALDPYAMRIASLRVAETGLAGPEAAEAAVKGLAADEEMRALNQVVLMLRVIEEFAHAAAAALLRSITTAEGQERVRHVLFAIAGKLELSPELLDKRLSQLGVGTYSVGVPWSPVEGRFRRVLRRLGTFRTSLRQWAKGRLSDAALTATFCAEVADLTLSIGGQVLAELDEMLANPKSIVIDWENKKETIQHLTARLAWLLDGWEPLAEWWFACEGKSDDDHAVALQEILPILPLVPRKEIEGAPRIAIAGMVSETRRLVRLHEDWITGDFDLDMVQRLENIKSVVDE